MLRAAWKSLLSRKLRLLMSAVSIVLGVAFVAGSMLFTNLLGNAYQRMLKSSVGDVNVLVKGTFETVSNVVPHSGYIEPATIEEISRLPGVVRTAGMVANSMIHPLDREGRAVTVGGAPGLATNFDDIPAMDGAVGMRLIEGTAPAADDEVALDPLTLKRSGHALGENIRVVTPHDGVREFRIVGTATYGDGSTAGSSYLFLTLPTMQQLALAGNNGYTAVWIQTEPGTDRVELAQRVQALLPHGFEAKDGPLVVEDVRDQLDVGLGFVNVFLLIFAGIGLLVAALLIFNTFSILVSQRSKELALLRALGAKRSQVRGVVMLEAAVVAVIGASLGILTGYGLAWLILAIMNLLGVGLVSVHPELTWQIVVSCYAVALLVTVVAALIPAFRASRTRPVEAMSRAINTTPEGIGTPAWTGLGLLQLGIAGIVCGVFLDVPEPLWWVAAGGVALLVGAVLATAIIGRPILWVARIANSVIFGDIGRMAARNASRQPRRTAATAATLMIGLTLVSTVAILAASATTSLETTLAKDQRGTFLLTPVNRQPFSIDVAKVQQIDGVEKVWTYAQSSIQVGDHDPIPITGTSPDALVSGTSTQILAGELLDVTGSVMLDHELSKELDLPMGKRFTVPGVDGNPVELLVTGVFDGLDSPREIGMAITNLKTYERFGDVSMFGLVKISTDPKADGAAVKEQLIEAVSDHPLVSVVSNKQFIKDHLAQLNTLLAIVYGLLGLAIVISVLGIVNTLSLSMLERTQEIGLLRAVGLTRGQLRQMVRLESMTVAVLGAVLGVLLGLAIGSALVHVIPDLKVLDFPGTQLVVFVVMSGIVGMMAAMLPAHRAAQMNVLDSIATE